MTTAITSKPSLRTLAMEATDKAVAPKQPQQPQQSLSIGNLGARLDAQVVASDFKLPIDATTRQQLFQNYLDGSELNDSEREAVVDLALADAAYQAEQDGDVAKQEAVKSLLSFDPTAWENHVGVLVAAIIALNVARQASAEMSGTFTQMAYKAAQAQGVAIREGGHAMMVAALSGAGLSAGMAVGGAAFTYKGLNQQKLDIKHNKFDASNLKGSADKSFDVLHTRPNQAVGPGVTQASGTDAKGKRQAIDFKQEDSKLDPREESVLKRPGEAKNNKADGKLLDSQLNEKISAWNLAKGSTLGGLAMVTSQGLTSILNLQKFAADEKAVLHQSEQNLNQAITDAAKQSKDEDSESIRKMLEAIQAVLESRADTMSTFANARA